MAAPLLLAALRFRGNYFSQSEEIPTIIAIDDHHPSDFVFLDAPEEVRDRMPVVDHGGGLDTVDHAKRQIGCRCSCAGNLLNMREEFAGKERSPE